jgi:hypothetical protein
MTVQDLSGPVLFESLDFAPVLSLCNVTNRQNRSWSEPALDPWL